MLQKIKDFFLNKYLASIVRHLLSASAGVLISIGIPAAQVAAFTGAANPIIVGIVFYLVSQASSLLEKKKK